MDKDVSSTRLIAGSWLPK